MLTTSRQIEPSAIEEQTLGTIRELLKELGSRQAAGRVSLHSSFDRDLGLGSLERVELLVRLETLFDLQLPDEVAQNAQTPAEWVQAIQNGGGSVVLARYRIIPPSREAPPAPDTAATLIEVLRRHTEIEPDRVHIHLPEDDRGQDLTYRDLYENGSAVAAGLIASGLARNETVAIMLPTCADFFYGFFGVIIAGGIPVPIYPPARADKIEEYVRRQVQILRNAEIRFLITFRRVKAVSQLLGLNLPSLLDVTTVEALRAAGAGSPARAIDPAEIAFIQYTSGSTGEPKGVTLTHANILANIRGIGHGVRVRPTDVVVSWLPLYHDMGLIGSWLFSVYYATPITILSPLAFLSRPERWLWAMHDARGTLCPAPNFSYELCARKIPDRALEGLDLSPWRVAINAGEAVLPETLARFTERFGKYGFRLESFLPCYGLAESSVALVFPPINRAPRIDTIRREPFEKDGRAEPASPQGGKVTQFVSAGSPLPHHEVRLLNARGEVVGERQQGRLFFRGPSRTRGYYRNAAATTAAITADGWMDSGDLAYWTGGELFITGRLKDCIIKFGRNIIPQEVEAAASEVAGIRRGCVAAFGVVDADTGTERLVIVAETRANRIEELRRIEAEVIQSVDAAIGLPPDRVQLVSPQCIPKTSSGKIRRNETKSLFLAGRLHARRRPPWLQFVRLGLSHAGSWIALVTRRGAARIRQIYTASVLSSIGLLGGSLMRLIPARTVQAKIAQSAARVFLSLSRRQVELQGTITLPGILVVNHPGRLDCLVLAAALPHPIVLADAAALSGLPPAARFLLSPLLAGNGRRDLEAGRWLVVFPESAIGETPYRSRFRLHAFQAAVEASAPVYPVAVAGTSHLLESARHPASRKKPRIVVGPPILPQARDRREIVRLRDQAREQISYQYG